MKKYKTAALFVVAIIGLSGLLIYRSEYIHLRSTFEDDFNIFDVGYSAVNEKCLVLNESTSDEVVRESEEFGYPLTTWTNLSSLYLFSAFGGASGSSVIGLGVGSNVGQLSSLECRIWLDYRDVLHSEHTTLQVSSTYQSDSTVTSAKERLEFTCSFEKPVVSGSVYMFDLIDRTHNNKVLIPIRSAPPLIYQRNASVLCVYPDIVGLNKIDLVEFIGFHQNIGFSDVIVYDLGIHYGLLSNLKYLVTKTKSFHSFSIIRWNFPVIGNYHLSRSLVEKDCQYRTSNKAKMVAILSWQDYILPLKAKNINRAIANLPLTNDNTLIDIPTLRCCKELEDEKSSDKSWPMVMKKTNCIVDTTRPILISNPVLGPMDDSLGAKLRAVVHRVDSCSDLKGKTIRNYYRAFKFLPNVFGP